MEKIYNFLENSKNEIVQLETLLSSIPAISPESGGQGEIKKAQAFADWLAKNDFKNIEWFNAPDPRVESGVRPSIVVTIPGECDKNLWIISHMDVVPVGEKSLWNTDPWNVVEKDGKLFGRGVEDNQQGIASATFMALAFLKNNIKPYYTIKLLFVADEECGSVYGIQYLLEEHNLFSKDDLVVIPDGGDPKGETIEVAEKNLAWAKFTVTGKQSHGSLPNLGVNAHLAGAKLILKLNSFLYEKYSATNPIFDPAYSTFEPTKKESNVPNINTIPGQDVFYMDMRILPQYQLNDVEEDIKKICAEVAKETKTTIEHEYLQYASSPATPNDAPVVHLLSYAIKDVKKLDARLIGIGGGTVASYLRNIGIDAVVWSTLEEMAHQPNESCIIDNIVSDAKVLANLATLKSSPKK